MNDLLKTEFFVLMNESSQQEITNEEMQKAYGNFIKHVEAVSSSNDNADVFRMLNITRIELVSLSSQFRYEQEKKCA